MTINQLIANLLLKFILLILIPLSVPSLFAQNPADELTLSKPLTRQIKGGETQTFEIKIKAGQFTRVEVEQQNIDVVISLFAPDGKLLIEMGGDSNYLWRESISVIAEKDGTFKLQIEGKESGTNVGNYAIRLAELRKSIALDRQRIEAEKTLVQAIKLNQENKQPESAKIFEASLNLWKQVGDKYWEAVITWNLAYAYFFTEGYQFSETDDKVLKLFNQVLPMFQNADDRIGEAAAIQGIGIIYRFAKKYDAAKENLEKALAIRRELKRLRSEYYSLNALIVVYYNLNRNDKVIESQRRMEQIADGFNDKKWKAETLKASAEFYRDVYNYEKASEFYEKALPLYQELKDTKTEIDLRQNLGLIYGSLVEYEKAKIHLERYAELVKESGDTGNWVVFQNLGLLYEALNQYDKTQANYAKALELAKTVKDNRNSEAQMLNYFGSYYSDRGQYDKAKQYLEESLRIARELKVQQIEQSVLFSLANLYLKLKEFEKAENYSEQSLAIRRKRSKFDEAQALNANGLLYSITGKDDKARENFELALKINREIGDKLSESSNLEGLALIFIKSEQYEKALVNYENSLKIAREKKNQRKIISALSGLGSANNLLSRFEKAKEHYEEALRIAESLELKSEIGSTLNSLGNVYINLSQYETAETFIERALKIAQETKEIRMESISLTTLGRIYSNLNQYSKARENYEKVLEISRETKNLFAEYDAVSGLGFVHINLGQYDKAKEYLEKAGKISREIKLSEIDVMFGLGAIYTDLNNRGNAVSYVQQSLEIAKNAKNRRGEGVILGKLAEISLQAKQYEKAEEYYKQALAIAGDVKNIADESDALINLGEVYMNLNKLPEAEKFYQNGLELGRKVNKPSDECYALNGLGELFFKQKNYIQANNFYRQALPIARQIQIKKLEGRILKNLLESSKELKKPELAIVYGKQAINIYQEIRGNIKNFDKGSQQSYLQDKEAAYRTLADILISQERFPEAQIVLDLLKEEEYSQLARTGESGDTIPYSDVEAALLDKIENLVGLERWRSELLKIKNRTAEQESQAVNLLAEITQASSVLDSALKKLSEAEKSVSARIGNFDRDKNLKGALTTLQTRTHSGVVALYTVLGKDPATGEKDNPKAEKTKFGWVILVTEKGQKAYPIDVTDFNETVFQLKDALSSDQYDPRPLAQKLYNAIFRQKSAKQKRTLEQDLREYLGSYQNKTLMWSLDGVLRYIPMTALHDGKNYLAETYLNAVFTEKSISSLLAENLQNWTVLGLGVSEQRENFAALPGVKIELETIVREATTATGILEGAIKLNGNFKKESFYNAVSEGYPVIHIASHYSFKPTAQKDSFLLVGDGHLTFAEMFEKDKNLFGAVDLLTLSACETGVSGNGTEAEGFPYKAQELGAKAVIASLWKVSDEGTPELMIRFYKLRSEHPEMSKGEAFRQAQLAMLGATAKADSPTNTAAETSKSPRSEIVELSGKKIDLPPFIKDARNPFAHPHYWSSFVLIGNWR